MILRSTSFKESITESCFPLVLGWLIQMFGTKLKQDLSLSINPSAHKYSTRRRLRHLSHWIWRCEQSNWEEINVVNTAEHDISQMFCSRTETICIRWVQIQIEILKLLLTMMIESRLGERTIESYWLDWSYKTHCFLNTVQHATIPVRPANIQLPPLRKCVQDEVVWGNSIR